jgi:hypothetical protein
VRKSGTGHRLRQSPSAVNVRTRPANERTANLADTQGALEAPQEAPDNVRLSADYDRMKDINEALEGIPDELKERFEQRASGFAKVIGQKESRIAELQQEAEQIDRWRAQQSVEEDPMAELALQREILEVGKTMPDESRLIERLLNVDSLDEAVEVLRAALHPETGDEVPADVDRNNPVGNPLIAPVGAEVIQTPMGPITREAGLELLRNASTLSG